MKNENILGLSISAFAFVIYFFTLAPTVNFIDSGELAAVSATLGIAHPTGYPLFTLLGYIFSKLPFGISIIYKLNLMAAVFSALSTFFFFKFLTSLFKTIVLNNKRIESNLLILISSVSTLILSFSKTFWSQSTSVEVYSLHSFFLSLLLYLFIRAFQIYFFGDTKGMVDYKYIILFFYILGLSFTNHLTTILLIPTVIFLFYQLNQTFKIRFKELLYISIIFLLGISVYSYLMIRAYGEPAFNWGNPVDLEKLSWHLTGKQYRVWIFSSTETTIKQLIYYLSNFSNEFNYLFIAFGLLGLYFLLKIHRRLLVFTLLLFITCVVYAINYDIHDIDSYFLLSYFIYTVWIAFGVLYIADKLSGKRNIIRKLIYTLPLIPLILNYNYCDESKNYLVEDYMKNMFESVEKNSLILSFQWDNFISASYYFQGVENYRKDVVVIDKELLRRSWYFKQLEKNYPEIYYKSKDEINLFLIELYKFEHNIPYDVNVIESRFAEVIRSIIEKNFERKVYVTPEIEDKYLTGYKKIPSGLCYLLVRDGDEVRHRKVNFNFRGEVKGNKLVNIMKNLYLRASIENGIFSLTFGDKEAAREYFSQGLKINPDSKELRYYLQKLGN